MSTKTNLVDYSARIYRLLLFAYPAGFRHEYSREMAQVFRDDLQASLPESGPAGLVNLWFLLVIHLVKTALAEHFREPEPPETGLLPCVP